MSLIIPKKLQKGSRIAIVSSSWGWPWACPQRYEAWVIQLEKEFGVTVIPMPHTLKSSEWVYENPKARAEDFMNAFCDPSIDGIISSIGGDDSIRLLPYIDFDIIRDNPKVFMRFSDTTVSHFICHKAGIRSYYWPAIMAWFAENGWMHQYLIDSVRKTLFSDEIIGELTPNRDGWTDEFLDWGDPANMGQKRKLQPNTPWRFLQGDSPVEWTLLGGCIDVFYFMYNTPIWPTADEWKWKILYLETSEEKMSNDAFERILRTLWVQWILQNIHGILVWRAQEDKSYDESILKIVNGEFGLHHLPIVTNMDFGHTDPIMTLPIWAQCCIDPVNQKVYIDESGTW